MTFTDVTSRRRPTVGGVLVVLALLVVAGCGNETTTTTKNDTNETATTTPPATSPAESFDQEYGTFTPVSKQGSSDGVVDLPTDAKAGLVTATYAGESNFAIEELDSSNQKVGLLVNTIGAYTGTTAWGFGPASGKSARLKVTASGGWTIKLAPIGSAPLLGKQNSGKGDAVCLWTGPKADWAITNKGEGNFVVTKHAKGLLGHDLLVNEIGNYDATQPVTAGPAVTTIESDGDWTISTSGGADAETGCGASNDGSAGNNGDAGNNGTVGSLPKHCSPGLTATLGISCELASNTFYEYYRAVQNGRDTTALQAWSPATRQYYTANCSKGSGVITCRITGTTDPNAAVQITQAALDNYTPQHARDYAQNHDLGPNG